MKKVVISLLCMFALCACGDTTKTDGTSNQSNESVPQAPADPSTNSTIDDFMSYLKDQGVEYADEMPLENMNITAHEGRSFTVNGNTGYLYRVDSSDDTMKKLLSSAQENGYLEATQDGVQKSYNAHVNGDYLFVYDKDVDMQSILKSFPSFNPNAPYTSNTVNPGAGSTTTPEE